MRVVRSRCDDWHYCSPTKSIILAYDHTSRCVRLCLCTPPAMLKDPQHEITRCIPAILYMLASSSAPTTHSLQPTDRRGLKLHTEAPAAIAFIIVATFLLSPVSCSEASNTGSSEIDLSRCIEQYTAFRTEHQHLSSWLPSTNSPFAESDLSPQKMRNKF